MYARNILCPVDFSENSEYALRYATSIAVDTGAKLHIVHVYAEPIAYTDGFAAHISEDEFEEERAMLKRIVPPNASVPYQHEFLIGHPADRLVEYAEKHNIDLIVMGTHGRTGLSRLLMGSIAEAVVRRAECPILTLKGHPSKEQAAADVEPESRESEGRES